MNTFIEYTCVQSVPKTLLTTEHSTSMGTPQVWCLQEGNN